MEYLSGNFLCETIVPNGELIVSRTDLKGIIMPMKHLHKFQDIKLMN